MIWGTGRSSILGSEMRQQLAVFGEFCEGLGVVPGERTVS